MFSGSTHVRGGFLMLPEPVGCRLVRSDVPAGIPALYGAVVPKRNHVFNGKGGYDDILGRFRYRGAEQEIESSIERTLREFHYTLADVSVPRRPAWPRMTLRYSMSVAG
ncbi:hypothetical protein [Trinickia terrae]|uniref:hypothetical protein n=1 Tax=Trinickia terrae TaxID=2571161 RepID=UPI00197F0721|nr:hypothetical protein [Trinickia terrae]